MAKITRLEVGDIGCCCYIVAADGVATEGSALPAAVIDPGDEPKRIDSTLRRLGLRLETVFLTHSHLDHIGGVDALLALWPGAVLACSEETSRRASDAVLNLSAAFGHPVTAKPAGKILTDGESFQAAGLDWRAVEIPGHDPGEMVYILGNGADTFVGDTIFAGSIGRSDLPGGDGDALVAAAGALLASLPRDGRIHPGHGPSTTVANEMKYNPFLKI